MTRVLTELVRYVARLVGAVLTSTALVFLAIEISIPGGFRAVLFPNGFNRDSATRPQPAKVATTQIAQTNRVAIVSPCGLGPLTSALNMGSRTGGA